MSDEINKPITVKELKDLIKDCPDNAEVVVDTETRCFLKSHLYAITNGSFINKDVAGHDVFVLSPSCDGAYFFDDLIEVKIKQLQTENEQLKKDMITAINQSAKYLEEIKNLKLEVKHGCVHCALREGEQKLKWIEILYNFLGPELFDEFEAEFYSYNNRNESLDEFCEYYRRTTIINAFTWEPSRKGLDFWVETNSEFMRCYEENNYI